MKQIFFRLIILVTLSLLGGLLYAFSVNLMIMGGMLSSDTIANNFGRELTEKTVLVWLGAIVLGFISVFIQADWRKTLLFCPLLLPSLFALIYVIIQ
ncbi:MAG: hypothetical protein MRY79_01895 [Alphaproteobacteria bacterium]|nr:hypothetical protein [Alphaproteobacteria bacterium]